MLVDATQVVECEVELFESAHVTESGHLDDFDRRISDG